MKRPIFLIDLLLKRDGVLILMYVIKVLVYFFKKLVSDIIRLQSDLKSWDYFCSEEKEAEANGYSPCVFSIRQTPNYEHHQFLFWNCKLTRFPNYEFPEHLRWKEYSCAVSTSAKNFVRKRDLVMNTGEDWRQLGYRQVRAPSLALSAFMSFSLRKKGIFL